MRAVENDNTTQALLDDLETRGYKLWVGENSRLQYEGPAITPVVWHALQANYGKLVRLLSEDSIREDAKRCASETVPTDATFYECPVDGRPCEVLEPLRSAMEAMLGREDLDMLVEGAKEGGLPCGGCRKGAVDAHNLPGLKLGRHERRILLGADDERYQIVFPEGPGRAAEEANRRALRKLERVGLVELSRHHPPPGWEKESPPPKWFQAKRARSRYWYMGRAYRSAKLTPLGALVVDRGRVELEGGAPMRWKKLREDLAKDVRKPLHELLGQFGHYVEGVAYYSGLGAAFGRTARDKQDAVKRRAAYMQLRGYVAEKVKEGAA